MKGTFNERLSELLSVKKITQKELAKRTDVTEAAMSHYIKGDRTPRASVLVRIAETLGTTTDYLLNGNDNNTDNEIAYAKSLLQEMFLR
ncbi:MAG: helix-turn-helix transcriptional regulator [Clostridia bacterium]|nr:helix-turn-helix transcriptional regulator [Clostridia bacterium]